MVEQTIFPHMRGSDQEHVGYIRMTEDGLFVPIDLLWNELDGALDLSEAETLLEELGLGYLAEEWWLDVTGHPERVKVRIQEINAETVVLGNADFGYPADIGTPFTEPTPLPVCTKLPTERFHLLTGRRTLG